MIGVLGLHYMNKNIGGGLTAALPANVLAAHVLESLCIISVNIFVLISGYFMINRKMTGLSKAVELYLIMLLYRLLFYAVGVYSGSTPFSWKGLLFAGIPFINGKLWFLETYMLLLLFAPFVNILIEHLNQNAHLLFIVLWMLIFSVWSSFLPSPPLTDSGYGITNFITLYLIAAYIRKYIRLPKNRKSVLFALIIGFISVLLITASSFTVLKNRAWDYCYFFNIIASTAVFYAFLNLPETYSPAINTVAELTFGVYICHANDNIQNLVYHRLMRTQDYINSPLMPIHFAICIILQFAVFAAVDYLRQMLWKPTVGKYLKNSKWLEKERLWELTVFN